MARPDTQVMCIEALPATAKVLNSSAHSLGWPIHVVHAAVTATMTPGTLRFPASLNVGSENLGLSGQSGNWHLWIKHSRSHNASGLSGRRGGVSVVDVPALTVDAVAERRGRPVEVLLIDAEGHDPNVMKGAARTLASGTIGYLEFEVNNAGAWKFTSLNDTVVELDHSGFDCFWAGKSHLFLITRCWHAAYENRGGSFGSVWGNVVCAHRKHSQWHDALWQVARSGFPELPGPWR